MYENIQIGHEFEVYVFGPGSGNHIDNREFYERDEFARAVRDFLVTAGEEDISRTDTAQLIFFYVQKYLKSLRLKVEGLRILSTRNLKLDRFFGVDALLFARVEGVDCVVSIDAYAAIGSEVEEERKQSLCYSDFQSRVFRMKLGKKLEANLLKQAEKEQKLKLDSLKAEEKYIRSCIEQGRPSNYLLLTPQPLRQSRGLKEFSRNIAISFWEQVNRGVHLKYCSISGFTHPVTY